MDIQRCEPILKTGQRYRLVLENLNADDHRIHLHRHTLEVRQVSGSIEMQGLNKDVVPDHAKSTTEVEFLADNLEKRSFIVISGITWSEVS
jgi:FtsP/CotA-like multicopper oxidase with cupredoxin domain